MKNLTAKAMSPLGLALVATLTAGQALVGQEPTGEALYRVRGPAGASAGVTVDVDGELLRAGPARLALRTPEGGAVTARRTYFEDRGPAGVLWRGRVGDEAYDSVILTAANGVVAGRFGDGVGRTWRLGTDESGAQTLTGLTGAARRDGRRCRVDADFLRRERSGQAPAPERSAPRGQANREAQTSTAEVDVLMVYTPDAARVRGGAAQLRTFAQSAVDYLNTSLSNSRVDARARLVHVAPAPANIGFGETALDRLLVDASVARLRDRHAADVVHLLLGGNEGCWGIAESWEKGDTRTSMVAKAFGVTALACDNDDPAAIFAHEVGHNFGGMHDPDTIREEGAFPDPLAYTAYAYGFTNTADRIHTVMSYGPVDGNSTWVPWFSNVDTTRNGAAVGKQGESEAARLFRFTTPHMAQLKSAQGDDDSDDDPDDPDDNPGARPAAPTNLTGYATGARSVRLSWTDNASDETGFVIEYSNGLGRLVTATVSGEAKRVAANVTQVELSNLKAIGLYTFTVRALGAAGNSAPSDPVSFDLVGAGCREAAFYACLQNDRFEASITFTTDRDGDQQAQERYADLGPDSTVFYFFDYNNVEFLLKVLDGCGSGGNGHFWVFGAAATDLEYRLFVRDTRTDRLVGYYNPKGTSSAITDSTAFDTCSR